MTLISYFIVEENRHVICHDEYDFTCENIEKIREELEKQHNSIVLLTFKEKINGYTTNRAAQTVD